MAEKKETSKKGKAAEKKSESLENQKGKKKETKGVDSTVVEKVSLGNNSKKGAGSGDSGFDWLMCIFLILALLGVLYTINSDIILQHDFSIGYPFYSIFKKKDNIDSSDIFLKSDRATIGDTEINGKKRTFIFALDTSKSMEIWEEPKPFWYDDTIDEMNSWMTKTENYFIKENNPSPFGISKVRLSQLLLEMNVDENVNFVVWKFGDNVETLFPEKEGELMKDISFKNIMKAIIEIKNDRTDGYNTDFTIFFEKLLKNYPISEGVYDEYEKPTFVLVMVSDLIHDMERKIRIECERQNKNEIETNSILKDRTRKDKVKLKNLIWNLSKSNLLADVIILSEALEVNKKYEAGSNKNHSYKIPILNFFEHFFGKERLEVISISENIDKLSYDRIKRKECINFHYRNPNFISKTSFKIRISECGKYYIGLTPINNNFSPPISIDYCILNTNNSEKIGNIYRGKLYPGKRLEVLPPLQPGEKIKLSYTGHVPIGFALPHLKIYLPNEGRKTFIIPIKFIKDLPLFSIACFYFAFFIPIIYRLFIKIKSKKK